MPMYAEIAAIGKRIPEVIDASNINIVIDIFQDRDSKAWLVEALGKYFSASYFNNLGNEERNNLIQTLVDKIAADIQAIPNATKAKKKAIVDETVKRIATELNIPAPEPQPEFETLSAYPLGMLATDHVGYLSYSLTNIPKNPFPMYNNLQFAVYLYPMGKEAARVDALQQARITPDVILAKLEIEKPVFEANLKALNLPAMQNPDLADWYMSPGSFAALPSALIGADGCENLFPANFATQEFRFRQVVRVSDVPQGFNIPSEYRFGYVDEYKVSLLPIGHSLGEIKYSLPLAPGESVKLAIIDWSRTDSTVRTEDTQFAEKLMHDTHRDRSITETVQSALNEWQRGGNVQGGANVSLFGIISIGGGGGYSTSSGSRELAAANTQKLSDSFSQASSALREFHSTVVVQSKQEEKQNIQTRTFTNYNHSHTLTILYYEILRHYKLVSEWVNRKAVALLPSDNYGFDDERILKYRYLLEPTLLDKSLSVGFDLLKKLQVLKEKYQENNFDETKDNLESKIPEGEYEFSFFELGLKTGVGAGSNIQPTPIERIGNEVLTPGGTLNGIDAMLVLHNGQYLHFRHNPDRNDGTRFNLNYDKRLYNHNFLNWQIVDVVDANENVQKVKWKDIAGIVIRNIDGLDAWLCESVYLNGFTKDNWGKSTLINHWDEKIGKNVSGATINALLLPNTSHSFTGILGPNPPQVIAPKLKFNLTSDENYEIIKLKKHINDNKEFYNRVIYLNTDVNATIEWFEKHLWGAAPSNNQVGQGPGNIITHVEPIALEVFGSYIAYPLLQQNQGAANLSASSVQKKSKTEKLISLPTKGIFAEGKLGHCNISEEIDDTRFWKWEEHPIPINAPDINPITAVTPQNTQQNVQPTSFPSSTVNIVSPSAAPDPQGLAEALKAIATPNIFRDMSGRQETADLIKKLGDGSIDFNDAVKKAKEIEEKYGGKTLAVPLGIQSTVKDGGTNVQPEDKLKKAAEAIKSFSEIVPPKAMQEAGIEALQDYVKSLPDERLASNDPNITAATNAVDSSGSQIIIDDESKKVLTAMGMSKPGTMMRHVADYCSASLNSRSLLGIVRSDHGNLLKPYVTGSDLTKLEVYVTSGMPGAYAWYQSVQGDKGYIMFQKDGFHGQIPAKGVIDPANEWRAVLAHEIQHARNIESSLFPEGWAPTQEFYIDVNKAKDLAGSASVSVWNCIRHIVGELAGRFVNWYVWQEIGHPDNSMVTLPTPESFFKRCFKEVKENLKDAPYDTSGYIKYLYGISDDKLAEQVAVWLEHVAHRCYLFDAVCNPPLKGKNIFLAAASAYKADRTSWKTATISGEGGIH